MVKRKEVKERIQNPSFVFEKRGPKGRRLKSWSKKVKFVPKVPTNPVVP